MRALHPAAVILVAVASMCATLALGADLGQRDVAAQQAAQGAPILQVYARGEAGSAQLDQKAVAALRSTHGVRAAVAITELPVTLSGLNFGLPVTVYAAMEKELAALSLPLQQGALPDSAWQAQALCGANLAQKLVQTVGCVPGTVRLNSEGGGTLDVQLSGIAQPSGTPRDDGLWLDARVATALLPAKEDAAPLPVTRAEVEVRSVAAAQAVADALRKQGFLVENPAQAAGETLRDGSAMVGQWGVLTVLALAGCVIALWRRPPRRPLPAGLVSLGAAAVGIALAAVAMQTAMLLGARFFVAPDARYLLDAPRLLAVGLLAAALPVVAAIRGDGCMYGEESCA